MILWDGIPCTAGGGGGPLPPPPSQDSSTHTNGEQLGTTEFDASS